MTLRMICLPCALLITGCLDQVECADGTFEVDGECRAGDVPSGPACGPGTHFDFALAVCVPDLPPTRCDETSTDTVVDENGVTVCVGNVVLGCNGPIACPSPSPGKVSVCGQLVDLAAGAPIEAPDAAGVPCAETTADGPCALQLELFDALAFAANPNSDPLAADEITVDDCGRYRAVNVVFPFSRTIGVAVDDAPGADDVHALTGVAFIGESGQTERALAAYATPHAAVDEWTSTAGHPFGPSTTFADKGVYVPLYEHAGERVAGVQVTAGGATHPADAYYFSDTDRRLTTVDPALTTTGPNGAALLVNSPLGDHGGTGGETPGCHWASALAAAIPGVVFVQEKQLVDDAGDPCP